MMAPMGGSFIWIIIAIVVINVIGGLLQQAAKRKEEQRKIAELRRAAPRTEPTAPARAETTGRMAAMGSNATDDVDIWHGRAAGDRGARSATAAGPSAAQAELERRRQAQLEELRRRRTQAMGGTSVGPASPTMASPTMRMPSSPAPPPPPPPRQDGPTRRPVAARAPMPERPEARPQARAESRAEARQRRQEPQQARLAKAAPVRNAYEMGTTVPLDAMGRAAVRNVRTTQVAMPVLRGKSGLAKLREAIVMREVLDRPLALRPPELG